MEKIRDRKKQEEHLTMTVGVIFLVYMVCNLPVSIVLLLDPTGSKYTQAHLPCYILAWLSSVIKPFVYVGCSPAYRLAFTEAFSWLGCRGFILQPVQRLLSSYSADNEANKSGK